ASQSSALPSTCLRGQVRTAERCCPYVCCPVAKVEAAAPTYYLPSAALLLSGRFWDEIACRQLVWRRRSTLFARRKLSPVWRVTILGDSRCGRCGCGQPFLRSQSQRETAGGASADERRFH